MNEIASMFLALAPTPVNPATGQAAQPGWTMLVPMLIMFVLFYFVLIRPQTKARKQLEKLIASVKSGDGVVCAGGILGTVSNVKDKSIIVKIADNVKIEVQKSSITSVERAAEEIKSAN